MNITIINQYAGNKGDRAVLYALCNLILKENKGANITVATSKVAMWDDYFFYKENNIKFVPGGWDFESDLEGSQYYKLLEKIKKYTYTLLRENYLSFQLPLLSKLLSHPEYYNSLKNSDLIISTGGHHFTTILSKDLVSDLPYELAIALSLKKRVCLFSQSIGPFEFSNSRNKKFVTKLLNDCSSIYIREEMSREYLLGMNIGVDKNLFYTPETVLSLNSLFDNYVKPSNRDNVLGLSIYSTKKRNEKETNDYIAIISTICNYAINKGFKVRMFPMEIKNTEPDDRKMLSQILSKTKIKENCEIVDKDMETKEHIQEVAKCSVFIGHKTHSTIFALASGTPLIAIAYHPKTIEFMKQFDLEEYAVNDDYLSADFLVSSLDKINQNLDVIGDKMFVKSVEFSKELSGKMKELLK
jgi:polysaccharide pyruvyl transferase WcaK-like protein